MDLTITARLSTDNVLPDPSQIAALIPAAFAQLDASITVRGVTIEVTPIHYSSGDDFPNANQPPAVVPPPLPTPGKPGP